MKWKKLIPVSMVLAVLTVLGLTITIPAAAEEAFCGYNNGDVCESTCTKECSNGGGCCGWVYKRYSS